MPEYLRLAIRYACDKKDIDAAVSHYHNAASADQQLPPESPLVVFINSNSGGRLGPQLKQRLQDLITPEQVFFLSLLFFIYDFCSIDLNLLNP